MLANHRSLMALADKLYRRNPAEWRKRAATREAALADIERSLVSTQPWPPLGGRRDVTALSHALAPDFAGWTLDALLRRLRCPVLAMHGDRDEYGSLAHARRIVDLSSAPAKLVVVRNCGHIPHREKPERVLHNVQRFLRSHEAT